MNALGFTGWDDLGTKAASWRVEKPETQRMQIAPFFPDQNGGVYEKMLAVLPVALHAMDGSGRLMAANRAWCETLGYALHEILGKAFSEFLPAESRSHLVKNIYPKYLVTGACRSEEILVARKDGSLATVLLSMTAYRGDKGRLEKSVCLKTFLTRRSQHLPPIAAISASAPHLLPVFMPWR
jgi:PAS domain S-box-containing protein